MIKNTSDIKTTKSCRPTESGKPS